MKAFVVAAVALAASAAPQTDSPLDQCLQYCKLYSSECCEQPQGQQGICGIISECTGFIFPPSIPALCDPVVQIQCSFTCGS
ncbi:hypothetical protein ESCO_004443 [Escovopsis weberi]|uniref:Uncharacterized protein n=1 Tax=Escovopsis weberi TaxID=150374 RepID=A0A0M9VV83_ESCWE|nr:hypothetical protein ESCO_004443 [Escovopsis weberi]